MDFSIPVFMYNSTESHAIPPACREVSNLNVGVSKNNSKATSNQYPQYTTTTHYLRCILWSDKIAVRYE